MRFPPQTPECNVKKYNKYKFDVEMDVGFFFFFFERENDRRSNRSTRSRAFERAINIGHSTPGTHTVYSTVKDIKFCEL